MPLNWQLWDRIRAFTRKANIYRTDNVFQDQDLIDRIISSGNFIDLSKQSALLEQTNLQINRLERYKDYDMMDEVGEITLALDMYADESSLADSERKHSVLVKAKNTKLKGVIEDLLYNTLLIDREVRPMIRYLCKFGDFAAEIIPTKNRDGVASFRFVNAYNFTRIQTKYGDLVGFFYQDPAVTAPVFLHPWQVIHMRLTSYETVYHPYGRSILDGARKDFKRLRLMEDAALIYRITRAPEKRIFSIPVGNLPAQQIDQYIELIARRFKKYKFVDPATGQVNERYNPLIQDDDFFLPKRADGSGPTIDTLPGAENLDSIKDIEYFKKKMISALKIPFNRVGIGDPAQPDGKSLASVSPEFAKAIQWIQREMVLGLKKLVVVHLALRGHDIEELKGFDLYMTAASAIDELYRIETWNTRADIMANLKDIGWFPPEWVLERFTDMTRDEVQDMLKKLKKVQEQDNVGKVAEPTSESVKELEKQYQAIITEDKKTRQLELDNTPRLPLEWIVNQKELDGLPNPKDKNKLMVESSIPEQLRNEVIAETKALLTEQDVGVNPTVKMIAEQIQEQPASGSAVISESSAQDESAITQEDLPEPEQTEPDTPESNEGSAQK